MGYISEDGVPAKVTEATGMKNIAIVTCNQQNRTEVMACHFWGLDYKAVASVLNSLFVGSGHLGAGLLPIQEAALCRGLHGMGSRPVNLQQN